LLFFHEPFFFLLRLYNSFFFATLPVSTLQHYDLDQNWNNFNLWVFKQFKTIFLNTFTTWFIWKRMFSNSWYIDCSAILIDSNSIAPIFCPAPPGLLFCLFGQAEPILTIFPIRSHRKSSEIFWHPPNFLSHAFLFCSDYVFCRGIAF